MTPEENAQRQWEQAAKRVAQELGIDISVPTHVVSSNPDMTTDPEEPPCPPTQIT